MSDSSWSWVRGLLCIDVQRASLSVVVIGFSPCLDNVLVSMSPDRGRSISCHTTGHKFRFESPGMDT